MIILLQKFINLISGWISDCHKLPPGSYIHKESKYYCTNEDHKPNYAKINWVCTRLGLTKILANSLLILQKDADYKYQKSYIKDKTRQLSDVNLAFDWMELITSRIKLLNEEVQFSFSNSIIDFIWGEATGVISQCVMIEWENDVVFIWDWLMFGIQEIWIGFTIE